MPSNDALPRLPADPAAIVDAVSAAGRRILLWGPPGNAKAELFLQLARHLEAEGRCCYMLNADPGSPVFGPPGAVSLARWQGDGWAIEALAALCSLDAGRFRLPLICALQTLLNGLERNDSMVIHAPGLVRGLAARELLRALAVVAGAEALLIPVTAGQAPPLPDEVNALPLASFLVEIDEQAPPPGKHARGRMRTERWDEYLGEGVSQSFRLDALNLTGAPPPADVPDCWTGRQAALLKSGRTLALGEVQRMDGVSITLLLPREVDRADTLLIRDAERGGEGRLQTAAPFAGEHLEYVPPADVLPSVGGNDGPRIVGRAGALDLALVNGVFGDPLLHLRVRHRRRSLLFDLGEGSRLPARIAHQVTDVFVSHAHMDHIGGFPWLLRSRIGDYPPCRLYGPPGLARHLHGFISGVLWDRVENSGPAFEVMEYHSGVLKCFYLQAGIPGMEERADITLIDDVLADASGYRVRGLALDHQGVQSMAWSFEPDKQINVRRDRLQTLGLRPGAWLNELKQRLQENKNESLIVLPDGSRRGVAELAGELVTITPGKKLVYATDLADTPDNRARLIRFAHRAHTFFCEASFCEADADHALRNGHLTTRACGEIAAEAGVARLVPFHFSRRYANDPRPVYDEISRYCSRVWAPDNGTVFQAPAAADTTVELKNREEPK